MEVEEYLYLDLQLAAVRRSHQVGLLVLGPLAAPRWWPMPSSYLANKLILFPALHTFFAPAAGV
jgi:hypothetical protein